MGPCHYKSCERVGVTPEEGVGLVNSPGTYYCITFTPPFVSEDFNTGILKTPSFDGALHIEIVVSLLSHLFFLYFFNRI